MRKSKWISRTVAGVAVAGMLAGCAEQTGGTAAQTSSNGMETNQTAEKETAEKEAAEGSQEVRILSGVTGGKDDEEMKLFEKALSEATGLQVTMEKPPSDYNSVLMQKLQGGEQYDLIYVGDSYARLVDQGALMDLTDIVAKSDILTNNIDPKEWEDIKIDGKIYGGFNKLELHRVVALNKVMLEAAGIDYQEIEPTLDGYYNVFKKLREANSDKDFYPFNAVLSEAYDLQPWMAAAGLKDGIETDTDGKTYVPYATEAAKPVYEWLKKLYDEGLLDPASFVDQTKDMRNKMGAASKKTAVCVDWAMWVGLHNANAEAENIPHEEFEIVSLPGVENPEGSYMLVKGGVSLFGIPVNAKNPEGAVKVLEYFATQEGGELLSLGIEGHDYTKDGDQYTLTDIGKTHGCDHGAPRPIFKDFKNPVGYNTGVDEALTYLPYAKTRSPRADEKDYKSTIGKWTISMVKGDVSIDEGIQKMADELHTLGYTDK